MAKEKTKASAAAHATAYRTAPGDRIVPMPVRGIWTKSGFRLEDAPLPPQRTAPAAEPSQPALEDEILTWLRGDSE